MSTLNFFDSHFVAFSILGIISAVSTGAIGLYWHKSGAKDTKKEGLLVMAAKILVLLFCLSISCVTLSSIIKLLRAAIN
jgi:threonine/homoserine/homoserine lactone efflux protein